MTQTKPCTLSAMETAIGQEMFLVVEGVEEDTNNRYAIAYRFGSLSGWLDSNGVCRESPVQFAREDLDFPIPESFYQQIPNQSQGALILTLYTYSRGELVGSRETSVGVYADPVVCAPALVAWDIQDVNPVSLALTEESYQLIKDLSTARVETVVEAKHGAAVAQVRINGVAGETVEFPRVDRNSFLVEITDSRGFISRNVVSTTMADYLQPTNLASVTAISPEGEAVLDLYGRWYDGAVMGRHTALSVTYRVGGGEWITASPARSGDTYSTRVILSGLDYTKSLQVQTQISDGIVTVARELTARGSRPVFDWSGEDFRVNVPACVSGAYLDTVYLENSTTLTLTTRGNGRQVYFLLGTCNWLGRIAGVLWTKADRAEAVWEGNPEVTIQSQSVTALPEGGAEVTVTLALPGVGWDDVVILSNKPISATN